MNGISVLIKGTPERPSPLLPCEDTGEDNHLRTRTLALARHGTCWCLDVELPASRTVRNVRCLSPGGVFVTAAGTD